MAESEAESVIAFAYLSDLKTCGVIVIVIETRLGILISPALSLTHVTTTSTTSRTLTTSQTGDMIRVQATVHISAIIR